MASRILANLLVAGGAMLFKAATTAYKQAIINASKSGMTAEGIKQASRTKKNQISLQEAQQILGVDSNATWEEIMEKYNKMFDANEKNGSFYLLSKIYRAQERMREEFDEVGDDASSPPHASTGSGQQQHDASQ